MTATKSSRETSWRVVEYPSALICVSSHPSLGTSTQKPLSLSMGGTSLAMVRWGLVRSAVASSFPGEARTTSDWGRCWRMCKARTSRYIFGSMATNTRTTTSTSGVMSAALLLSVDEQGPCHKEAHRDRSRAFLETIISKRCSGTPRGYIVRCRATTPKDVFRIPALFREASIGKQGARDEREYQCQTKKLVGSS